MKLTEALRTALKEVQWYTDKGSWYSWKPATMKRLAAADLVVVLPGAGYVITDLGRAAISDGGEHA